MYICHNSLWSQVLIRTNLFHISRHDLQLKPQWRHQRYWNQVIANFFDTRHGGPVLCWQLLVTINELQNFWTMLWTTAAITTTHEASSPCSQETPVSVRNMWGSVDNFWNTTFSLSGTSSGSNSSAKIKTWCLVLTASFWAKVVVQSALPISLEQAGGREGRLIAVARESILGSVCPGEGYC